ncbi:hypothetical protein [Mycetocola reblochoni]|uniref:hypothetical protein n=1 Tax=Mycetocola reblochoni TaxID=331618 RepID=UPI003F952B13
MAREIDPDTGLLYYGKVIVTVQRQFGKTDLDQADSLANCLHGPGRRVWYTAQSGQHASDAFTGLANYWEEELDESNVLRRATRSPRRSNGSQELRFLNGSTFRPFPPTANALHGKQGDKVTVDEAWAFPAASGNAILAGLGPTTLTRAKAIGQRPQIWIQSTEGTVESTWFNPMLDEQRARRFDAEDGQRIAFFDFGIPEDADPTDLNVIARWHPGFGHLFDMPTLEQMAEMFAGAPGEFARAFGNRRTGSSERIFPLADWDAAKFADPLPEGRVAVGAALGVEGTDATIVYAVRQGDRIVVEVAEHRPGTRWALPRLLEIKERAGDGVGGFAIDRYGPSATLADQAERAGLDLIPLTTSAVAASAGNMLSWLTEPLPDGTRGWRHRPHAALDDAAELATRRFVQDGAWTFGRRLSVGSISAIEAANAATWAVDHMPEPVGIQVF